MCLLVRIYRHPENVIALHNQKIGLKREVLELFLVARDIIKPLYSKCNKAGA